MNLHIQAKGQGEFCIFGCSPFGPQQNTNREKSEIEMELTFLYKSGDPTFISVASYRTKIIIIAYLITMYCRCRWTQQVRCISLYTAGLNIRTNNLSTFTTYLFYIYIYITLCVPIILINKILLRLSAMTVG